MSGLKCYFHFQQCLLLNHVTCLSPIGGAVFPSDEAEKLPQILITLIISRVRSEDDLMFSWD